MSVSAVIISQCKVTETLETSNDVASAAASSRKVIHSQFDENVTLVSTSDPPATKIACFVQALTAGAATLDLTALPGTNGATVSGDGLKVQYFRMKNLGANEMTIDQGDSHGYALAGAAFSMTLKQNQYFEIYGNDATPDIANDSADEIDLAGTTTQTAEFTILMG